LAESIALKGFEKQRIGRSVEVAIAQRDKLLCYTGKKRNNQSKKAMIQEYLNKAMETAHYEFLEDNEGFYGNIPNAPGVWATGETLEACRRELLEVLEEWILLAIKLGHQLPEFDGLSLKIDLVA